MSKPNLLIVARDSAVCSQLKEHLVADFHVDEARDGFNCLGQLAERRPSLIIMDTRTSGLGGWKALQRVLLTAPIPVILLVDSPGDRIRALQLGADDSLTNPVDGREVAARTTAVLRRYDVGPSQDPVQRQAALSLDPTTRSVGFRGRVECLSECQYGVLAMLVAHPGQVVTRKVLWDRVWGPDTPGDLRIIDRHVMHLRRKLDDPDGVIISNVWGIGYRFTPIPEASHAYETPRTGDGC